MQLPVVQIKWTCLHVVSEKKDKMEEGSGVSLKFLLPSGCDELSVTQALHEAWERCSEAGLSLSWVEEETILKLKSPVSEKVNKSILPEIT